MGFQAAQILTMAMDFENLLIKVILKVLDENRDEVVWEHLCYAPRGLYLRYLTRYNMERSDYGDAIAKWAKEDFNIDLPMTTTKDIQILRILVLDKYKSVYPHINRSGTTDRQGWLRVWVSTHMEKDLLRKV